MKFIKNFFIAFLIGIGISIGFILILGLIALCIKIFGDIIGIFIGLSFIGALSYAWLEWYMGGI
jgi:hypothetical protein